MTKLFVSGVPKNDCFQFVENGLVKHRLISIHPDYVDAGFRYLNDLLASVNTLEAYEQKYGRRDLDRRDRKRRRKQEEMFDTRDYCLRERLSSISLTFEGPQSIIVDSGAFTDWGRGVLTRVEYVERTYARIVEFVDGRIPIIFVNLDVIPGKPPRAGEDYNPSEEQKREAIAISDRNFERLCAAFPKQLMPVYHQGEPDARLDVVCEQAMLGCGVIGVSPTNGTDDGERAAWAKSVVARAPDGIKTHGLATTGNKMLAEAGLWSADSASAERHGGYGQLDLCVPKEGDPPDHFDFRPHRYIKAQVGREQCEYDLWREEVLSRLPDHYDLADADKQRIVDLCLKRHGHWPFAAVQHEMRIRSIINAMEIAHYAEKVGAA